MKLVIQRVSSASVTVDQKVIGLIEQGLLILVGIGPEDSKEDVEWLCGKVLKMRVFSDEEGKMNLSVQEVKGSILVVSQFTLFASTKKGNRPSFTQSAPPQIAIPLYEMMIEKLRNEGGIKVATGVFGADMKVSLVNDGPVTIIMDSKNKV